MKRSTSMREGEQGDPTRPIPDRYRDGYVRGYARAAEESEAFAALRIIRAKVHAHNRGGVLSFNLREEIRDICDTTLHGREKENSND